MNEECLICKAPLEYLETVLKAVVTIEDKIDLERKGKQSFQGRLFVRITEFGNGSLAALYDRSDGFYRRQIALQVKNKDQDRIDDTRLGEKLIEESEGIALWMLEGLHRLIRNDYKFTISPRTARNMEDIRKSDNNMVEFYESEGYIRFDKSCHATTKRIYGAYVQWCQENVEKPLAEKTFTRQLRKDAEILGITYGKEGLQPIEKTGIDRCVHQIYQKYFENPIPENMPLLEDLYNALLKQEKMKQCLRTEEKMICSSRIS